MNKKVLLGMSGGIDSSVAAIRLLDDGLRVTGVTFLFSGNTGNVDDNAAGARNLARMLGIEHHIVDLRDEFEKLVVNYFVDSYRRGLTPFPCAVCNPQIKFSRLIKLANQLDCAYIATGHYVQVVDYQSNRYISEGVDPEKDQSFFLWGLNQEVTSRLLLPLGSLFKGEVRKIASGKSFDYLNEQKESLGICFIKDLNYRQFIENHCFNSVPGPFVDAGGNRLGMHTGIIHYTVGQRKGLNLRMNKRMFVKEIRPGTNEIVLGEYKELYRSRIFLRNIHFINACEIDSKKAYKVRIRYRLQENDCRVLFHGKQKAVIELFEPVAMVAPGQTAVIYEQGRVLGGGFIEGSE